MDIPHTGFEVDGMIHLLLGGKAWEVIEEDILELRALLVLWTDEQS